MNFINLSEHLLLLTNKDMLVGVVIQDGKALIIDPGDGSFLEELKDLGVNEVEGVLLTHHHRDQVYGAYKALEKGAWIGVPEGESHLFENVESYWKDPAQRWHRYYFRLHNVLPIPLTVHKRFKDGDELKWGPARITALSTPGHTDGSMSYLIEVDGKRLAFCGNLIYDEGKVGEVYSLQKGFGGLTDYHGFMFCWQELIGSLKRLISKGVDILIPSRGKVIYQPQKAVELLESRLKQCYENYLSTSALWHYFPQLLSQQTSQAPLVSAKSCPTPDFLRYIGTSWILLSEDGEAFLMDCGSEEVLRKIGEWISSGEIKSVQALWITHTHDDHTDAVERFRQLFSPEIIAEESVAKVISRPSAWNLPCLSPIPVSVDRVVRHRESWKWKEFTLTAYHFPGQSLYHGGLLVEGKGLRLFFAGDSFTPTGFDDYCAYNRNFLGDAMGYDFCLSLLESIKPDMIFNSHIPYPFLFSQSDLETLRKRLKKREELFRELFPWEDPNYGIDPYWAFCYPYEQEVEKGETARIDVIITNHLPRPSRCEVRLIPPPSWETVKGKLWATGEVEPKGEIRLGLSLEIPTSISPNRYVLMVDVIRDGEIFPYFSECIIEVMEAKENGNTVDRL